MILTSERTKIQGEKKQEEKLIQLFHS